MKKCVTCGKEKEETEFNWRYKVLGVRHKTCRECHKTFRNNRYQKNREAHLENVQARKKEVRHEARQYVFDYLSNHPCIECGETAECVNDLRQLYFRI